MLVSCTNPVCGVQYDHAMGRCVICGADYEPTLEERRPQLLAEAVELLKRRPTDEVTRYLVDGGLPEQDADAVLLEARAELREQAKQHGLHVAASGFVLLLIAGGVFAVTGGFLIATGCLAIGGAMVCVGGIKSFTGWNIATPGDE